MKEEKNIKNKSLNWIGLLHFPSDKDVEAKTMTTKSSLSIQGHEKLTFS